MGLSSSDNLPLVGPRAHERNPSEPPLTELRLQDGTPIYYLRLDNPEAAVIEPDEVCRARNELLRLASIDENAVRQCQGKTAGQARAILDSIELSQGVSGDTANLEDSSANAA